MLESSRLLLLHLRRQTPVHSVLSAVSSEVIRKHIRYLGDAYAVPYP